jgi:hypothetical protein
MGQDMHNVGCGEQAAKVRVLGMTLEFASVDFSAWISSNRSDAEIEKFIADVESKGNKNSIHYQNSIAQIAQYRAEKLDRGETV